jgi:hypothetical protein
MTTVWSKNLTNGFNKAAGYQTRAVLDELQISGGGNKIRIRCTANPTQDTVIDGTSIGLRDLSAGQDDFDGPPTRITWDSGNNGVTISAGTSEWSDWIDFSLDSSKDHLIHVFHDNATYMKYGGDAYGSYKEDPETGDDTLVEDVTYTFQAFVIDVDRLDASSSSSSSSSQGSESSSSSSSNSSSSSSSNSSSSNSSSSNSSSSNSSSSSSNSSSSSSSTGAVSQKTLTVVMA